MPAAFWEILILDLDSRGTEALQHAYRALHIQGVAEAGVSIDDDGQADALTDPSHHVGDLIEADQTNVRASQLGIGYRRARDIDGFKSRLLDQQGRERIIGPGGQNRGPRLEALEQGLAHAAVP